MEARWESPSSKEHTMPPKKRKCKYGTHKKEDQMGCAWIGIKHAEGKH